MTPALPDIPVPVRWSDDGRAVHLLDQTLLPAEESYLRLESVEAVAEAIRFLRVRGAPAIGITAALGLAMGIRRRLEEGVGGLDQGFQEDRELLLSTRPTAVNLRWALDRLAQAFASAVGQGEEEQAHADRWNQEHVARRSDQSIEEILGDLRVERQKTLAFISTLPPDDWEQRGDHPALGDISVRQVIKVIGVHERMHLKEIRKLLKMQDATKR